MTPDLLPLLQLVLAGALAGLIEAQYKTLRAHGHSPSEAFNETVEELTESLVPLIGERGMAWMFANTSTTAQRGALDWRHRFREVTQPVFEELYQSVASGHEADVVIRAGSDADYRARLDAELAEVQAAEIWRAGDRVRALRPQNQR
jgi:ketol-acid reductoisomerase